MRVNQVGYPLAADKRAYLMASVPAPGAPFTVTDGDGRTVAAGRVGPDLGRWSRRFPHVYPLDFTRVRRAGTFTLSIGGPAPARAIVRVGSGASLYAAPIRNALSFYRVQRDGPAIVRSALRTAPSHLNDADAMTYRTPKVDGDGAFKGDLSPLGVRIDAAGGWWDAGDYLKFVHTTTYTDAVLLMGVRDFPGADGRSRRSGRLRRRGAVRRPLAPADVGRPDAHALLPGRHRERQRLDRERPRHLAAAAGRRHLRRARSGVPVHPPPAGLPRRAAGLAGQPQPRRAGRRGAGALLPGVPHDRPRASRGTASSRPSTSSTSRTPRRRGI